MCYRCGTPHAGPVFRSSLCGECGADLKVCLNCKFYDPSVHWECRETVPEPVREKERSNFCDYFSYLLRFSGSETGSKSGQAKNKFDSLFGNE
ncbi:MAG: hypothetical protein E4H36_09330 [Spirochaetales bacterium]|nr:MAG: hypothetical protein E4H36_09330 [Spirochaetales bacterium]